MARWPKAGAHQRTGETEAAAEGKATAAAAAAGDKTAAAE